MGSLIDNHPTIAYVLLPRLVGAVSEWSKEAVLKTAVPQGTEGSNPSCSARAKLLLERCESGRIGLPAKELYAKSVPGVRIPPSPS